MRSWIVNLYKGLPICILFVVLISSCKKPQKGRYIGTFIGEYKDSANNSHSEERIEVFEIEKRYKDLIGLKRSCNQTISISPSSFCSDNISYLEFDKKGNISETNLLVYRGNGVQSSRTSFSDIYIYNSTIKKNNISGNYTYSIDTYNENYPGQNCTGDSCVTITSFKVNGTFEIKKEN
jgi:Sec-independent protein translocase protein TatA